MNDKRKNHEEHRQEDSGDKLDLKMDKDKAKSFNILDNIRAENKRQQDEEEAKAEEMRKARAAKEEAWQKAHEERLRKEKVEMMKLRQGAMEEPELTANAPKEKKEYTFKEKWDNYWFHYKKLTFGLVFAALLAGYFVYDMATVVKPDVSVLFISSCAPEIQMGYDRVEELIEFCSDDYNGDGNVSAQVMYLPIMADKQSGENAQNLMADMTRFMGEIQSGQAMLVFADREVYYNMELDGLFEDGSQLFPGDPNAKELGYWLYDTEFAKLSNISTTLNADLFLGLRKLEGDRVDNKKFQKIYSDSLNTLTRLVEAVNGRVEVPEVFTAISIPENPYDGIE